MILKGLRTQACHFVCPRVVWYRSTAGFEHFSKMPLSKLSDLPIERSGRVLRYRFWALAVAVEQLVSIVSNRNNCACASCALIWSSVRPPPRSLPQKVVNAENSPNYRHNRHPRGWLPSRWPPRQAFWMIIFICTFTYLRLPFTRVSRAFVP
jgi:hypothetical protein